jgi:acetyl esterase/lipase
MKKTLLFFLLLSCCAPLFSFEMQREVTYGKAGDVELKLDFIKPEGDGPFPTVVCIHGGGWRAGNKARWHGLMQSLVKSGFAAASVSYRFAPQYKFPAQIEDVKCAVRFLRSKAAEWKLDAKNFAALGDSAGGHLSLLLGLTTKADGLEGAGGHADHDSSVQAVVNYFGPTDFTVPGAWNPVVVGLVSDFLGTADQTAEVMKKASPITYVKKEVAPVITFQGTVDPLVPHDQATRLHEALKKAGATERLEIIQNAGHGFSGPDAQFVNKAQLEFLQKYLKKQ